MKKVIIMFKKIGIVCAALIALLLFSACGANSDQATPDQAQSASQAAEKKVTKVETPYTDLMVSEEFADAVVAEVRQEEPYILDFVSKSDNAKIFAIHFDDETENLLGTLTKDGKQVVLYAEFFELDKDSEHYQDYRCCSARQIQQLTSACSICRRSTYYRLHSCRCDKRLFRCH